MKHENALHAAIAHSTPAKTTAASLTGTNVTYTNQLGSVLAVTFNGDGSLSGTYTSQVSGGGQPISGPITGWYNGWVITWAVNWPTNPPTLTSWVGEAVNNGTAIDTLWYLINQTASPGDPSKFWTAVNAGSDTFTRNS